MSKIKHLLKNIKLTTPIAVIIGAIIIGGSIIIVGKTVNQKIDDQSSALSAFFSDLTGKKVNLNNKAPSAPSTQFTGKAIDSKDYVLGNAKSNVTVIEYSDPECPFCAQFHPTIKSMMNDYGNKISFVYRQFPLTSIHQHAFDESRAIACAGKIGGTKSYYDYMNALFDYKFNKQTTQLTKTGKEDLANSIGLDMTKFNSCMNNNDTATEVNDSMADGVKAGVQGTPSTFVLVKKGSEYQVVAMIDGARPYDFVKAAVDQALSK